MNKIVKEAASLIVYAAMMAGGAILCFHLYCEAIGHPFF